MKEKQGGNLKNMRRRIGLFHHSLVLLVLFSVLTLGLLVSTPKEASAFADLKEGNCAQCHDDGRKPEGTGGTTTPAPTTPAQPTESQSSNPLLMAFIITLSSPDRAETTSN